jgi:isopenicillin-N epimerase
MREHWALDPAIVFLNHGAFGACPRAVLEAQAAARAELEREPVHFFARWLEEGLDTLRAEVAPFVGARSTDVTFVRNATAGVNAVLASLPLRAGDAVLTTDHAYNACKNALDFFARRSGAEVIVAHVPFPPQDPGDIVDRVLSCAASNVRLALLDHVTSPTGLIFPIATLVRELRERGVETLVDGAHGPGMLPLSLSELGAAYYVGNFHKWVCAPKGAAMLWVREDRQRDLHPTVISHGFNSNSPRPRFLEEFDWTGSDDPTSWLAVPAAIQFIAGLIPGGWPEVRARNRALVLEGRRILADALDLGSGAPDSMIGSLATLVLPEGRADPALPPHLEPLHLALFERHRIEVPVFRWGQPPTRLVRISAHLYNTRGEYEALADALRVELRRADSAG